MALERADYKARRFQLSEPFAYVVPGYTPAFKLTVSADQVPILFTAMTHMLFEQAV